MTQLGTLKTKMSMDGHGANVRVVMVSKVDFDTLTEYVSVLDDSGKHQGFCVLSNGKLAVAKSEKDYLKNEEKTFDIFQTSINKPNNRSILLKSIDGSETTLEFSTPFYASVWFDSIISLTQKSTDAENSSKNSPLIHEMLMDCINSGTNNECADCLKHGPEWCNLALGVTICSDCATVHRSLSNDMQVNVKGLWIDIWVEDWVDILGLIGNEKANKLWKTEMKFTAENRSEYIKDKYSLRNLKKNALTDVDQVVKDIINTIEKNDYYEFYKIIHTSFTMVRYTSFQHDVDSIFKKIKSNLFLQLLYWKNGKTTLNLAERLTKEDVENYAYFTNLASKVLINNPK